ncbi:hypothetical protein Pan44_45550 [Caulifigura coniformis]|uniref:Uncharacterized protein n=1 Tax=Caulifigura coniformis TaxID=2527983 RepID=A0A517SK55_9PLAN|nr:hypothetical protein Pan44_45550 [Caulifigura coniformis]
MERNRPMRKPRRGRHTASAHRPRSPADHSSGILQFTKTLPPRAQPPADGWREHAHDHIHARPRPDQSGQDRPQRTCPGSRPQRRATTVAPWEPPPHTLQGLQCTAPRATLARNGPRHRPRAPQAPSRSNDELHHDGPVSRRSVILQPPSTTPHWASTRSLHDTVRGRRATKTHDTHTPCSPRPSPIGIPLVALRQAPSCGQRRHFDK